jgi:N-acetylmuramoyl-L-alanine amidase
MRHCRQDDKGVLRALLLVTLAAAWTGPVAADSIAARDRFDLVVIDAGHGGKDEGATGPRGLLEKELVLDITRRLASRLRSKEVEVVLTRKDDRFVPLEERTSLANDARGDLFISIHANAARSPKPRGSETYFVSLEASDAGARVVADRENEALGHTGAASPAADPLLVLLGDMMATDHMEESNVFAKLAQERLAGMQDVPSRGVKQAPFVVLMGVQMPAALIEIGFLSNDSDAKALGREAYRDALANALAEAVIAFGKRYDARRGIAMDFQAPRH